MGLTDITKHYEDNTIARVIVNAIPYIGGSVDILLTQRWTSIRQQRINDLLEKISLELSEIKETAITKEMLESEEFYDLVFQIASNAISSRCNETRVGYARVIKSALSQEETITSLEDIVRQISGLMQKDILYLKTIKAMFDEGDSVSGITVSHMPSIHNTDIEAELQLYRFENLGLLDHPRNMLNGRGKMAFHKMPLFDVVVSYLGL